MVDIITIVASRNVERMTMHNATSSFLLFEQGRKIEADSITPHIGGGAINAAVSMTRLGLAVSPIVKIGQDPNGERILERLADEGIDASYVLHHPTGSSGTAVMVSSHDRNATIFTQRGTNTLLLPDEFPVERFEGCELVFVSNLSNRSSDCFPIIAERAKTAGAFVAANPGIRQLTSRTATLFETMPSIDLLAINTVEAEALVPALVGRLGNDLASHPLDLGRIEKSALPSLIQRGLSFGGFDMDLADFMAAMLKHGKVAKILVTDGTNGAYLADQDGIHYCPALKAEPKGTAGAGDAFTSTVSAYLARGHAAGDALQAGACNAAGVVSEIDTQIGLMSQKKLDEAVRKNRAALLSQSWTWADKLDMGKQ